MAPSALPFAVSGLAREIPLTCIGLSPFFAALVNRCCKAVQIESNGELDLKSGAKRDVP